jgi:hypothetical protein
MDEDAELLGSTIQKLGGWSGNEDSVDVVLCLKCLPAILSDDSGEVIALGIWEENNDVDISGILGGPNQLIDMPIAPNNRQPHGVAPKQRT